MKLTNDEKDLICICLYTVEQSRRDVLSKHASIEVIEAGIGQIKDLMALREKIKNSRIEEKP